MPPARLETLTGAAIAPLLPALARLRIAVFRDWPYLYDGDAAQEEAHLASFAASPGAALVVARDAAGDPVGCATCQPMAEADAAVRQGFARSGLDQDRVCYFGESVLLAPQRGQGIGVGFFAAREAHARALGLDAAAFAAVVRNPNDPRRPADHVPLDAFWRRRGFAPRPELSCLMHWREVADDRETPHVLSFWVKAPL
jgi:GNAT superfamily N-acetyltransferase